MLSEQELETKLAASPAPRVTTESIESRITNVSYLRFSETVTLCNITLDNGYSVRGESACVSPENYDQAIGQTYAYKNAFDKLWPLFGFLLAEQRKNQTFLAEHTLPTVPPGGLFSLPGENG